MTFVSPSLITFLTLSYHSVIAVEQPERETTSLPPGPLDHPSGGAAAAIAQEVRALLNNNSSDYENVVGSGPWGDRADLMGLLVRLPFHDAATFRRRRNNTTTDANNLTTASSSSAIGGADGCVDLANPENNGLEEAINLLEPIRRRAEIVRSVDCVGDDPQGSCLLSRADVWALAGNVAIETAGGPRLIYRIGRVDASDCAGQGERHVSAEATSSVDVERAFVEELGLTHREVVALVGAHVLGRASEAVSGYDGPWVRSNDRFTNEYFVDMLHIPWQKDVRTVEPFGERTTWQRFEGMSGQAEIMLQTDVDLAFNTTGKYFCSRIGGEFVRGLSCPNATHGFAEHVFEFAADEDEWRWEFAEAWEKLTSMTERELECVTPGCDTPQGAWPSSAAAMMRGVARFGSGVSLVGLMWHLL